MRVGNLLAAVPAALLASLAATPEPAAGSSWESLQVHGFAAQAAIKTTDNRWFGPSDETSLEFTEVGINASLRPLPPLLLAGQVLSRHAGEMYDGTPAIDYALADIGLLDSPRRRAGIRLGRLKNPLGLYNETRDVPFTHPGIFLPQVVYFDRVRNLVLSTDGGMLYGDTYTGFGSLSLTLGSGAAVIDDNVEWTYLNADFKGDMTQAGHSWLASLWFASRSERLKLGLSGVSLSLRFDPDRGAGFTLDPGTTDILYWIASAQYNDEELTLTAEYAREPLEWHGFGPGLPDHTGVAEGYYVQGTYRPLPAVQLLLRYEEGFGNRKDRDGRGIEAATAGLQPGFTGYSRALSVGLRWDISERWMIRGEYARNQGTFVLSTRENPNPGAEQEHWDLFALQAVVRF